MKFDLRSRSWPDPNRSCRISFDPYWREQRNGAVLKPVSRFYQKLLAKNEWWPLVTSYGHIWPYEDSPRVFWISNLIYNTYSQNTVRTEQICWLGSTIRISRILENCDLRSGHFSDRPIMSMWENSSPSNDQQICSVLAVLWLYVS